MNELLVNIILIVVGVNCCLFVFIVVCVGIVVGVYVGVEYFLEKF